MRLLVLGLDPQVMDPGSPSARRQREYFRDWEVEIVVLEQGEAGQVDVGPGVRAFRSGGQGTVKAFFAAVKLVRARFKAGAFDLVTVQDPFYCGLVAATAGVLSKARFVVQDHSGAFARRPFGWKERLLRPFAFWLVRNADRTRTVSERGQRGLVRAGVAADRIDVIHVTAPQVMAVERKPRTHHLVTVARASKEKGLDVLLHAFARIHSVVPDATLTVIGDGPEKANLEALARELKVDQCVTFQGEKTSVEVASLLATAEVYVQPSRFEGWGMAVCEAALVGLPIVMTDVGLAGEVIRSHESGLVVPPNDHEALAQGILHLFRSPEEAKVFGDAARETVKKLPSREASVMLVRGSYEAAHIKEANPRDPVLKLYAVAFLARLAVLGLILWFVGQDGLSLPDSKGYVGLAQSLLAGKGFAYEGVTSSFRTIGYPFFLALVLPVLRSFALVSLLQIAIASFLPILTQRLGRQLGFSRRVRRFAAWMTALEPHAVYYAVPLLTEWIFPVLTLLAITSLIQVVRLRRDVNSVWAGAWFGVGLLVKALWTVVPFLLLVGALIARAFRLWRPAWRLVIIGCVTVLVVIAPWLLRNRLAFGTWGLSSQGGMNAVFYLGSSITSVAEHLPYQEAETLVRKRFRERTGLDGFEDGTDHGALYLAFAQDIILQHPQAFARVLIANSISFWSSHNYAYVPHYYHLTPPVQYKGLPPTHYLVQGRYGEFVANFWQIFGQPFYFIGAVGRALWAIVALFMVLGLLTAFRRSWRDPAQWIVLTFIVALAATVSVNGLGVEGRLRMPIMPLQWLYAGLGMAALLGGRRRVKTASGKPSLLVVTQRVDEADRNLSVHVRWLRWFAAECAKVQVITQAVGTYDLPSNVQVASLGKERGASRFTQFLRLMRMSWRSVREADVVFVLMSPLYVLLLWPFAVLQGKPVFLWYTHKHVSWTLRLAVRCVKKVFSASPESFRLKTNKVEYTGHTIDTDFFVPASDKARKAGKLVTVGRLSPAKRIEFMIAAVEHLRVNGHDFTLEIIGEPIMEHDKPYVERVQKMVKDHGLGWVHFVGGLPAEAVREAYQTAQVSMNASLTGSLDKSLLEAMACGCPVVTTNEAFMTIAPEGFVAGTAPEDFAAALADVLERPVSSERLRERILDGHRLSATLGRILTTITSYVETNQRGPAS